MRLNLAARSGAGDSNRYTVLAEETKETKEKSKKQGRKPEAKNAVVELTKGVPTLHLQAVPTLPWDEPIPPLMPRAPTTPPGECSAVPGRSAAKIRLSVQTPSPSPSPSASSQELTSLLKMTAQGQRATERACEANEEEQACGEGPVYGILLSQEAIKSSAFVEYLKGQLSENANLALKNLPFDFQTQAKILECTEKIKTLKAEKRGNDDPEMVAAMNELNQAKQETLASARLVLVYLSARELEAAKEAAHARPASFRLHKRILEVPTGDSCIKVLPKHYHGERGRLVPFITASKSVGFVEAFFPIHDKGIVKNIWRSKSWGFLDAPLEEIREYYGEEIAFYFAWVSFYSKSTVVPGCLGVGLVAVGYVLSFDVDHNIYAPFYGIAVAIWSSVFISYWNQAAAGLDYNWARFDPLKEEEEVRPEFEGDLRLSPITGLPERHYPRHKKLAFYVLSVVVTGCCMCVVVTTMFALLNMQGYIDEGELVYFEPLAALGQPGAIFDQDGNYALVPVVLYAIVVMTLNKTYRLIAEYLTELENHRLVREFENALILKRILFESFDCYAILFYIAFYQLKCQRLQTEVLALYTTDELRRVFLESILPYLTETLTRKMKGNISDSSLLRGESKEEANAAGRLTRGDLEDEIDKEEREEFDDFLELVIQFGYVCLFAAACPLAAALSVVSNMVEMRSDLFRLCHVCRRPVAQPARNIPQAWLLALNIIAYASCLTNCLIIGITSEQSLPWFPSLYSFKAKYRGLAALCDGFHVTLEYAACTQRALLDAQTLPIRPGKGQHVMAGVFAAEHLLIGVCFIIRALIPPAPHEVTRAMKREQYRKLGYVIKERSILY